MRVYKLFDLILHNLKTLSSGVVVVVAAVVDLLNLSVITTGIFYCHLTLLAATAARAAIIIILY